MRKAGDYNPLRDLEFKIISISILYSFSLEKKKLQEKGEKPFVKVYFDYKIEIFFTLLISMTTTFF